VYYPINEQLEVFVGDETWFSRVLWKHHNTMWAPCLVPLGPRTGTTYVPAASTQRLAQVTGSQEFQDAGVRGVDLGANTAHRGNHYVFFGDVAGEPGHVALPPGVKAVPPGADAIARVRDFSPDGVTLDLIRSGPYFVPFTIRMPDQKSEPDQETLLIPGLGQTPTGAFSDGTFAYVFYLVFDKPDDPKWPVPVSYLVRSANPDDGQPFEEVFRWSEYNFWQVAPVVVNNAEVPGLPSRSGRGVVLFGGGWTRPYPNAPEDAIHLAWMPLTPGRDPQPDEICYYSPKRAVVPADWSAPGDQASARPLWHLLPGYTSVSAMFIPDAPLWLVIYSKASPFRYQDPLGQNRPTSPVVVRTAPAPTGPWSAEIPIFDPCRDGAFGNFMHWPNQDDLTKGDPLGLTDDTGLAYGAFRLEPLTEWHPEDRSVTLHYLMSTWQPYQVQHMRSRFRVD
jgi:hypothetical protein